MTLTVGITVTSTLVCLILFAVKLVPWLANLQATTSYEEWRAMLTGMNKQASSLTRRWKTTRRKTVGFLEVTHRQDSMAPSALPSARPSSRSAYASARDSSSNYGSEAPSRFSRHAGTGHVTRGPSAEEEKEEEEQSREAPRRMLTNAKGVPEGSM